MQRGERTARSDLENRAISAVGSSVLGRSIKVAVRAQGQNCVRILAVGTIALRTKIIKRRQLAAGSDFEHIAGAVSAAIDCGSVEASIPSLRKANVGIRRRLRR